LSHPDDDGEGSPLIQYRNDGDEEEILQEREDHDDVGKFQYNQQQDEMEEIEEADMEGDDDDGSVGAQIEGGNGLGK
jgi:hypothetical protein